MPMHCTRENAERNRIESQNVELWEPLSGIKMQQGCNMIVLRNDTWYTPDSIARQDFHRNTDFCPATSDCGFVHLNVESLPAVQGLKLLC